MMCFIYCVGLLLISITEVELSVEIAQGKHVTSSRPYIYNGNTFKASLAVDGNTTNNLLCKSCFHSAGDNGVTEAYFTIDLNGNYSINKVEIFYRDDYITTDCPSTLVNSIESNYRFKGYSIHISSTRNWTNGITCYRDQSYPYPDLHVNNTCIGTGSFLTIYNNNTYTDGRANAPVLELCEVKVYGCNVGHFGPDCNSQCPNCKDDTCDPDNGTCQTYCYEGWQGEKCDQPCPPGRYGQNCSIACHNCIKNESCDHIDGHCSDCARGFHGIICDTECSDGFFGMNCSSKCGHCWNNERCHHENGTCDNGCAKGFNGSQCFDMCRNGTYGKNCENTCGHCLNDEYCDIYNGTCKNGCTAGWTNETCKQECSDGFFGMNCSSKCGHCWNNELCHHENGTCDNGCAKGFNGSQCFDICRNGTYGKNCKNTCGHCLNDEYCDIYNGTCKDGCSAGWKNETCKQECKTGYYGNYCLQKCSGNCKENVSCNHINGTCPDGCKPGYLTQDCFVKQDELQNSDTTAVAAGTGIGVGLLVIIGAIIIVMLIRRRRISTNDRKRSSDDGFASTETEMSSEGPNGKVYENLKKTSDKRKYLNIMKTTARHEKEHDKETNIDEDDNEVHESVYMNDHPGSVIQIPKIREIIARKMQLKTFDLEYKRLPYGLKHPHENGSRPENKLKNRYLTTFPYDHSLVCISKVNGKEFSDYINANFIDGCQEESVYIATQGPKPGTIHDLWRMVWETGAERLVMLTNIIELGKKKCEVYWPEDKVTPFVSGNFQIKLREEKVYGYFLTKELELQNCKTKQSRTIMHYHFTSWPDHGTADPIQLLLFHRLYRKSPIKKNSPAIIHCSAGIGRTGVFIALDALLKEGTDNGVIDVFEYIKKMRHNRMNMIQTVEQYIILHEALAEAFMVGRSYIAKDDFVTEYLSCIRNDVPKNKTKYRQEYQSLDECRPTTDNESRLEALSTENKSKNKSEKIIPDKRYCAMLSSHSPDRNSYINAIVLSTLFDNGGLIATQYPLPNTVEDFWCLIYDHNSSVIVLLQPETEDVHVFPSLKNKMMCGPFTVDDVTHKTTALRGVNQRKVQLTKQGGGSTVKCVAILMLSSWDTSDLPQDTETLLNILTEAKSLQKQSEDSPVTVVCPDGATRCGLFSVLYLTLEMLSEMNEVNIFQTARQIQLRRPQFIPTYEQYEFCYKVIFDHLESNSLYVNTTN